MDSCEAGAGRALALPSFCRLSLLLQMSEDFANTSCHEALIPGSEQTVRAHAMEV